MGATGRCGATSATSWSRNPVFWVSFAIVVVVLLMAFFPQLFAETSPNERGACDLAECSCRSRRGTSPFGYTNAGCDMWSSLVYGAGKSVIVAILVTIGTVILGVIGGHRRRLVRRLHWTP